MPSMYITSTVCMPHPNCKLTLVSFCVFMSVCLFVGAEVKSQNSWWSRMFLFFVRVASADQAASFLSFMPWSSQIFPRNQPLKNGPHAKSCHYTALQPNWLTQKVHQVHLVWVLHGPLESRKVKIQHEVHFQKLVSRENLTLSPYIDISFQYFSISFSCFAVFVNQTFQNICFIKTSFQTLKSPKELKRAQKSSKEPKRAQKSPKDFLF